MSPVSPAPLSKIPSLCIFFPSASLSSGCFRSSSGKGSVTTSVSYSDLQTLTFVVRSSTSAKLAGLFSLVSLLVSQPFCAWYNVSHPSPPFLDTLGAVPWLVSQVVQVQHSPTVPCFSDVLIATTLLIRDTRRFYLNSYTRNSFQSDLAISLSGPHGANIFDPRSWGNSTDESIDNITLEFTRIVIAVGVFAVGVELPKKYMYRHWKSLFFLLVPVMTWVRSTYSLSQPEAY